jgi:peptidoglycan/LPS O-acetylase OafA/YrhL
VCVVSTDLLRHLDTVFLTPLLYGKYGVAMFFAISGFCIHASHRQAANRSWHTFAVKRFGRLYPAYLVALLTFFFFWPWKPFTLADREDRFQFITHLTLVHNLDDATIYGINVSWWSIAIEVQLYVIYPLLCLIAERVGWARATALAIGIELSIQLAKVVTYSIMGHPPPLFITGSPFAYWGSWTLGALIADHFLDSQASPIARLPFAAAVCVGLLCGAFKPAHGFAFFAFALATGIAMERLFAGRWLPPQGPVPNRIRKHLSQLGKVSYSFYLFHQPILNLTLGVLAMVLPHIVVSPPLRVFAACLWYPVIFSLSSTLHRFVEVPSASLFGTISRKPIP